MKQMNRKEYQEKLKPLAKMINEMRGSTLIKLISTRGFLYDFPADADIEKLEDHNVRSLADSLMGKGSFLTYQTEVVWMHMILSGMWSMITSATMLFFMGKPFAMPVLLIFGSLTAYSFVRVAHTLAIDYIINTHIYAIYKNSVSKSRDKESMAMGLSMAILVCGWVVRDNIQIPEGD